MKRIALILTAALLAVITGGLASEKPTVKSIGEGVICQCGCNFPVNTCNHEQCSSRDEMKAFAERDIAAGKDSTAILQDFVLRYGTKVLATPPASGFNLSVWVLPGVGLIAGLAVVLVLVRRWRRAAPSSDQLTERREAEIDPRILATVEREMKETAE
jgi:cytochrome c-type biogenesis protein CcmH